MEKNLIAFSFLVLPFTWIMSQAYKMVIGNTIFGKKVSLQNLFADGNFPSTHSATSVATASGIVFLLLYMQDKLLSLTLSLIIFIVFEVFKTLRDACGCRYRQDKTNKILKKTIKLLVKIIYLLVNDQKMDATYLLKFSSLEDEIEKESKKRVGHKTYEVFGGALLGLISFFYLMAIFFNQMLLAIIIPISIFYYWFFIKVIKRKKNEVKKITKKGDTEL